MRWALRHTDLGLRTLTRIASVAIFGALIGGASAIAALVFVGIIDAAFDFFFTPANWLTTILVPTFGGLIVGIIIYTSKVPANTLGPPFAIRQAQASAGDMPIKGGIVAFVTSLLSLSSGASAGQYGPLTYFGASLGSVLTKLRPGHQSITIGIGCGVAAAISTAFNAPIAGIVFAHEVLLRHYSLRAFAPITVAATMGYIVNNVLFQRPALILVDTLKVQHAAEFIGFSLIGVLGAVLAVVYMRTMLRVRQIAPRFPGPAYARPMVAGAVLGVIAIWLPEVLGIGISTIRMVIVDNDFSALYMVALMIAKIFATAMCLGFGFIGGVFGPALFIGVLFGALVGTLTGIVGGDYQSAIAIYAICGMVAVTGPVIGAPLTTILIVFELTRNYDLTTAAMVSVVFSNLVAFQIFGRSFFDVELLRQGFDLSLGREKVILDSRTIAPWISAEFTTLAPDASLAAAKEKLIKDQRSNAYVVDAQGAYLGSIRLEQLLLAESDGRAMDDAVDSLAERDAVVLTTETTIWSAMDRIRDYIGESIPVVKDLGDDMLSGVVYEATIVNAYLDVVYEMRREEQGLG